MRRAYRAVADTAKARDLDLRTASFVLAIQRVGEAAMARRYVSQPIDL
jgi:glutamate dehydrogenase/leucine dehydrogenase